MRERKTEKKMEGKREGGRGSLFEDRKRRRDGGGGDLFVFCRWQRGWHCELVPTFDDRDGGKGEESGAEGGGRGGYGSRGIKISAQRGERKMEGGLEIEGAREEAKCEKGR